MSKEITQYTSTGGRVAELRKEKNLSQQEFADLLSVSRGYIGDIERDRCEPSTNFLKLLTSKLNGSADWILTGEGGMFRNQSPAPTPNPQVLKIMALWSELTKDQQKETLVMMKEKQRMNELIDMANQLQNKSG